MDLSMLLKVTRLVSDRSEIQLYLQNTLLVLSQRTSADVPSACF